MNDTFSAADFRRSRKAYTLECAFEYFVAILVADSFLAKLLTSLGFTDAQTGLVSSLISFAFLFQLLAIPVVRKIRNVKRFSASIHFASQLLFMSLYLIPSVPLDPVVRRFLAVGCLLLAYLGNYLVTTVIFRWGNSFVDPGKRALFSANKEMISLVTGIVISLLFGYFMDNFEAQGSLASGYIFAAVGILIFSISDLACLMLIKNDKPQEEKEQPPVREVLTVLMKDKKFRSIVLLTVLWDVARYMTIGFMGTFKLNTLLYTVGQVQIINIAGSLARTLLSRPFGRYSDRHSYAKGIELALIVAIAAFACNIFTNQETRWLIVGFTLLYSVCQAGMVANLINVTYSYVDAPYFVQANAIKNSIGGLCGFGASLLGSSILTSVQANGDQVLGLPLYGQQILSLISVALLGAALVLTRTVIEKQSIKRQ